MQRPLHGHILRLEERIQDLRDQLTDPRLGAEPAHILDLLQTAELALGHYRTGYELEQKVLPPPNPHLDTRRVL